MNLDGILQAVISRLSKSWLMTDLRIKMESYSGTFLIPSDELLIRMVRLLISMASVHLRAVAQQISYRTE